MPIKVLAKLVKKSNFKANDLENRVPVSYNIRYQIRQVT